MQYQTCYPDDEDQHLPLPLSFGHLETTQSKQKAPEVLQTHAAHVPEPAQQYDHHQHKNC